MRIAVMHQREIFIIIGLPSVLKSRIFLSKWLTIFTHIFSSEINNCLKESIYFFLHILEQIIENISFEIWYSLRFFFIEVKIKDKWSCRNLKKSNEMSLHVILTFLFLSLFLNTVVLYLTVNTCFRGSIWISGLWRKGDLSNVGH